ncbi:MAG: hypothetical protein LBJ67_01230 [Planctomycetaceae bacterium]|jgi:hypothetical protein|nr:hypothetical protein [Planctomycetaceae bacterium]
MDRQFFICDLLRSQNSHSLQVTRIFANENLNPDTFVHWKRKSQPPHKLPLAWNGMDIVSKGTADFKIVTEEIEAEKAKNRHFKILIIKTVFFLDIPQ